MSQYFPNDQWCYRSITMVRGSFSGQHRSVEFSIRVCKSSVILPWNPNCNAFKKLLFIKFCWSIKEYLQLPKKAKIIPIFPNTYLYETGLFFFFWPRPVTVFFFFKCSLTNTTYQNRFLNAEDKRIQLSSIKVDRQDIYRRWETVPLSTVFCLGKYSKFS